MITDPLLEKLAMIASKLGVSTETISKMTDEASKNKTEPAVTVTKVEVAVENEKYDIETLTDEQIDKMSESEAKDFLKKARDSEKKSEVPEDKKVETNVERMAKSPDMSRVMSMSK